MRIIISDSSCLIDLHKGGLLEAIFGLPYSFAMPQPLFEEELLSISDEEKAMLIASGMEVTVLPGEHVTTAMDYYNENRRLKLNDCFALVLAETTEESILFTGDQPLRQLAETKEIETHGVLWAIDEILKHTDIDRQLILDALILFYEDPLVRLPEDELKRRIRRLKKSLKDNE
ncbi:hypothetical protein Q6D67_16155 [Haliea sp. E1-2-M8]|uniref:PIN domain-containing protein n=1 Tax=Haliea sp. E1-2-M8 TaxID=3064706 RepID=UPI00271CCC42|nr:PIN domain-containing protein [Haliea sp. E1-2-M8]MDO8863240.1 hypothetical protein [Haliea sp. E1-2-M8]